MLVHTYLGNLDMLTRRQFIQNEKFNLTNGSKTKQLTLSGISTTYTFRSIIAARISQAPPMGDIGIRRPL